MENKEKKKEKIGRENRRKEKTAKEELIKPSCDALLCAATGGQRSLCSLAPLGNPGVGLGHGSATTTQVPPRPWGPVREGTRGTRQRRSPRRALGLCSVTRLCRAAVNSRGVQKKTTSWRLERGGECNAPGTACSAIPSPPKVFD